MRGMDDHAEALEGGDHDIEPDKNQREGEEPPPSRFVGDDEEDRENETGEDVRVAVPFDKHDARTIAVADAPTDKVGMGLTTEGPFDHVFYERQGGWVRCVL